MSHKITREWHNAIVTRIFYASCGDLILDTVGDVCTRKTFDANYRDLPWAQHSPYTKLATISREGWALTPDGAEYCLENFGLCHMNRKDAILIARLRIISGR